MADLTDEELMLMFKYGNIDAFDLLFEKYKTPLLTYLTRMVSDSRLAEDLLQEVFLRVVKAAQQYRPTAKFGTWLYTIATNCGLNARREPQRGRVLYFHELASPSSTHPPSVGELRDARPLPDEQAEYHELRDTLRSAIDRMPEQLKPAFLLRETQDRDYAEIAEILDMPWAQ